MDHVEDPRETDADALGFALGLATRVALGHAEAGPFLDWMREHGLKFFIEAEFLPDLPREDWPAVGTLLGRALWNHLPRPELGFKPAKLPEPGRNDPCPCGSGRKFKQCCGGVGMPPPSFPEELLLPHVLGLLSKKDLAKLPHRRFNPELLAAIARDWMARGETDRGRLLLEPLFAAPDHLDGRHAEAFDALMDIYLDLAKPRKRRELLAVGLAAADPVLRATARQRQALMAMDNGDAAGAWAAFQAAQRDHPDDPNLAPLELSLLQGEDRTEQVRERARFWAAKFRRRPDAADLADLIAFLEDTAADADSFAAQFSAHALPGLERLADRLADLPAMARPPRIEDMGEGLGRVADGLPETLYDRWNEACDAAPLPLDWLDAHSEAWDSLAVLDDLAEVLEQEAEPTDWLARRVMAPLFQRVQALADAAWGDRPAAVHQLPWGFMDNRPWHRLLLSRAQWLAVQGRDEDAVGAAEALLAWNPEDNLGVRDFLAIGYARLNRHADLLALCERYADDFAAMRYNRALALFALGRRGEALTVLAEAVRTYPKLLKSLLAANPKAPRPDRFGVAVGGEYEAWLYREGMADAWRDSGALDWARQCATTLKAAR